MRRRKRVRVPLDGPIAAIVAPRRVSGITKSGINKMLKDWEMRFEDIFTNKRK